MGARRPQPARSLAVAVARSLDHDHPVAFREPIYETIDREVLDQRAIVVNERQGLATAMLDVVEAHAVHLEKATDGRVLALRLARLLGRIERRRAQGCG